MAKLMSPSDLGLHPKLGPGGVLPECDRRGEGRMSHPSAEIGWAYTDALREAFRVGLSQADARDHAEQVAERVRREREERKAVRA